MANRIIGFDLARVLSIFVVIGIYHNLGYAGHLHSEPAIRVLVYSSLGVFTFISAFLLASNNTFKVIEDTKAFYKRRLLRIWPLFTVSSIMLAVLGFNSWGSTLKGIIGISPFWAPHPTTMWYVAMLISLYIITPFVVKGSLLAQCIKGFLVMAFIGFLQLSVGTVVPRTFNYYTVYLAGLLLGRNYYDNTLSFLRSRKTILISISWILLVFIVFITKNSYLKSFASVIGIIAILNSSLLISEVFKTNKSFTQCISVLSYASFCAYLFHREIIWALFRLYKPDGFLPVFLEVLIIAVPLSFLIAYYIQKAYDSILRRFNLL